MMDFISLPNTMYFGAAKQMNELKGNVFLTPHIGIASLFIIDTDDLFAQLPRGYDYKCNISYRQWFNSNDFLTEPLKVVNAFHNIVELEDEIYEGYSCGYIHEVDISDVKDKLSLFVTNDPDREVIYNGEEPLVIKKCIPHTVMWDFSFSKEDIDRHGVGIVKKLLTD